MRIRALMETALAERNYEDIQSLAALAARLSEATRGNRASISLAVDVVPARKERESTQSASSEYPRFERDEDRLVKVGWSKKDRRAYEHRTPLSVANAVIAALIARMNKRGYIQMDKVLPVKFDGEEVPSYQAYVVVAWLRSLGILTKQGNDGYKLDSKWALNANIDELLQRTPERS